MRLRDTIVRAVRERLGTSNPETVADGGAASEPATLCSRRANAWAGVYAATFDVDGSDTDER